MSEPTTAAPTCPKCKGAMCDGVIWPPKDATAAPAASAAALEIYDPAMQDFANKLRALLPNGSKLSANEALAGAQYAKTTGLDPFRGEFYIVPGIGVTPGYKGVYVRQGQQGREPLYTYRRELTPAEIAWNDIEPGDKAVICEATDPAEAAAARKDGREPRAWQGIGIVRAHEQFASTVFENGKKRILPRDKWGERLDPPVGRSWGWKAENRAMKDCANHMGIPVEMDAETILAQTAAAGVQIETLPAEARLDAEQAQAAVAAAFNATARAADPRPPVITSLGQPAGWQGYGDDAEEGVFTAAADPAWDAMPSASAGKPPLAPKAPEPVGPKVSDPNPPTAAPPAKAAKVATIKTKLFFDLAADLAKQHPYYRNKNGDADTSHICASLAQKLGIDAITDANVMEAMNLLADHATAHANANPPTGK